MNFAKKTSRMVAALLCAVLLTGLLGVAPLSGSAEAASDELLIGAGVGDITGPVTEISTGYNSVGDLMQGLLMKLYARAFVVADSDSLVCYVSAEIVHMTESIKPGVIKELQSRGLSQYTEENVMLAATHCHSSPSNTSWYALYDLINGTPGFDDLYYNVVVDGIADAIENADASLQPGSISLASGDVDNAVYNRSVIAARQNNDVADDASAADSVNKEMVVLRFTASDGTEIGLLDFFGSHGTSNNIDNVLVSADHKGYAAYEFEQYMGGDYVAAFAQSESGDSSPNQPQADDETADFLRPNQLDSSLDIIENEIVHGEKELTAAKALFGSAVNSLGSSVDCRYTRVNFSDIAVSENYVDYRMPWDAQEGEVYTSEPCIGAGIIAGDEEGAPVDSAAEGDVKHEYTQNEDGTWTQQPADFTKIDLSGLEYLFGPLWPAAMKVLKSDGFDEEQAEKVVCLNTGSLMQTIQPLQVFTIGDLAIVGVPFELTSAQANRTRAVLEETLGRKVVFSTLTNSYSQYVTTREEYAAQHYEGATCLFGPWSGAALTQELDAICHNLVNGETSDIGPAAPDKSGSAILKTSAAQTGVVRDSGSFGTVKTDVKPSYTIGDTVSAVFQGAAPRNVSQCRINGTLEKLCGSDNYNYMEVQKKEADGSWTTVRTEADPYTTYQWARDGANLSSKSLVTLTWLLRGDAEAGTYRFKYNGISKNLFGSYKYFSGTSGEFTVD